MSTEYTVSLREQISGPADKATAAVGKLRLEIKGLQGDLARVRGSLGSLPAARSGGAGGGIGGGARVRGDVGRKIADDWQKMAAAAERASAREAKAVESAAAKELRARERTGAAYMRQVERDAARRERIRERENNAILRDVAREQRARERAAAAANRAGTARAGRIGAGIGGAAQSALGFLGGGIKGGIAATLAGTAYLGKEALASAQFKQNAERRLTAVLGDALVASNEVRDAYKIAEKTEFDPDVIVEAVAKLSNNFKEADSRRYILGSVADFSAVTGAGSEGMKRAIKGISDIANKSKLEQEELTGQLGDLGLNVGDVYKELAPLLGIKDKNEQTRNDKVRKQIKGGKVSGNVGVQAITNVMRNMAGGGAAGSYAGQGATTISGQVSNIEGGFKTLFGIADVGQWAGLAQVKGILGDIAGLFDSDSKAGQGMTATIRGIVDAFEPLFTEIAGDVRGFKGQLEATDGSTTLFAKGLATVVLRGYQVAKAIGYIVKALFQVYGAAVRADEWLGEVFTSVIDTISELPGQLFDIGVNVVGALGRGIKSGLVGLKDTVVGINTGIINTISEGLGIQSPSKVAMRLGAYTAEGFAIGLGGGMQDLEVPQIKLGGLRMAGGAAGRGGGITVQHIYQIGSGTDPRAFADEAGPLMDAKTRATLDNYFGQIYAEGW